MNMGLFFMPILVFAQVFRVYEKIQFDVAFGLQI